MSFFGKKILVTGGAGFIGSHLCKQFVEERAMVYCLDNLSCSSGLNIAGLRGKPNFRFLQLDVCDPLFLPELDYIFHLACPASPVWYSKDPVKTLLTSVLGTKHMLDLAARTGARVLFTSTSEVYGDPKVHPQPESYSGNVNINGTRACYDEGKRAAETLCSDFHRAGTVDARIVRLFNTYGPNMAYNDGRVVSNFITQAIDGKPLTLYGTGLQTRSFCYVEDTVNMMRQVMLHAENVGPINIGNPQELTVRDIAGLISMLCETTLSWKNSILPADDPQVRKPEMAKYYALFGEVRYTDLPEGIRRTIAYFRELGNVAYT